MAVDWFEQDVEEDAQGDVTETLHEVRGEAKSEQRGIPHDVRRGRRRITPYDDSVRQDHLTEKPKDDGQEHRHTGNARISRDGEVFAAFCGNVRRHGSRRKVDRCCGFQYAPDSTSVSEKMPCWVLASWRPPCGHPAPDPRANARFAQRTPPDHSPSMIPPILPIRSPWTSAGPAEGRLPARR